MFILHREDVGSFTDVSEVHTAFAAKEHIADAFLVHFVDPKRIYLITFPVQCPHWSQSPTIPLWVCWNKHVQYVEEY
jgi:hypothetical protein